MSKEFEVVLNTSGVRKLLRSPEMMNICSELADGIQKRCGEGYKKDTYVGKNRVNAQVRAVTYQAKADNSKKNTIMKALKG